MEKKVDIKKINEKIKKESAFIDLLTLEINKVIIEVPIVCKLNLFKKIQNNNLYSHGH